MLKKEIKHIINLLDDHIKIRPNHKESCIDLKKRFISFQDALEKEEDVTDFINWCKWFAPRIIFDGIGNKGILESLERLNENHLT
jgi:hypothetical protein